LTKNLAFYTIAGTVIALVAEAAGASFPVVLFAGLIGPPVLLLTAAIIRYRY